MSERIDLPEKVYFTIGEVARFFGVSTSLIRYWEDEFPHITPRKNGKGDRRYTRTDVEKISLIYELIKEKGFTIRGAQAHLTEKKRKEPESKPRSDVKSHLQSLRNQLIELKNQLLAEESSSAN